MAPRTADIGVFGGSGFYSFLDDVEEVELDTPFGPPSAPVTIADGRRPQRRVRAAPRPRPRVRAALVPARANLWAMRMLGVRQVIGPCAAGSLSPDIHPGDFVVLDQLVDRTWGRPDTYYDAGDTHHVSFADPYCPVVARHALEAGERVGIRMHDGGTVVVIPGPGSRRAPSRGGSAPGLGRREHDPVSRGVSRARARHALPRHRARHRLRHRRRARRGVAPVTQEQVFAFFEENLHHVRTLLLDLIPRLPGRTRRLRVRESGRPADRVRKLTSLDPAGTWRVPRPTGPGGR